jgi:hypothetical protein
MKIFEKNKIGVVGFRNNGNLRIVKENQKQNRKKGRETKKKGINLLLR